MTHLKNIADYNVYTLGLDLMGLGGVGIEGRQNSNVSQVSQ